jgi:hypothetical protein
LTLAPLPALPLLAILLLWSLPLLPVLLTLEALPVLPVLSLPASYLLSRSANVGSVVVEEGFNPYALSRMAVVGLAGAEEELLESETLSRSSTHCTV